ncbi:hypothetical protein BGY98DRAFT_651424 [Russula aff. rugulosa BPL654]|nr:hypothetical protein BGY98DRAFT_651424 [Russula aff. rugulosa BPL654]
MKSWRNRPGRYDTIFVNTDSSADGMQGVDVACIRLFFRFLVMALNIPMLWCIGSRVWVIHQMSTQAFETPP